MSLNLGVLPVIDPCTPPAQASKFIDPDPSGISVGDRRLDEWVMTSAPALHVLKVFIRSLGYEDYFKRYDADGRPAFHPAAMLALILFGFMTGRTSLRQIQDMASYDIRAWWLSGGILPTYSSICRFLLRHDDVLNEKAFVELTKRIISALGRKVTVLSIDGTVIQAAASRYNTLKEEAAKQIAEELREAAAAAPADPEAQRKVELANEAVETVQRRNAARQARGKKSGEARVSPSEPQAVIQPLKEGGMAPAYKASVAVSSDRIILGVAVDPSNEAAVVAQMLDQAKAIAGSPAETVLADAGYLNATVVDATASRGAELIAPEGRTPKDEKNWDAKRKQLSKNEFKYDPQADTYTCPAGRTLKNIGRFKRDGKKPPYSQYRCKNCENCPFSERCLAVIKGKRSTARTIKRYESDAAKQEIRTKLMSEERRRLYRQRQTTVEPVHGEIKMLQAGRRFRRRGLKSVRLEYTLHAMSHNLRRFCILQARTNG